MRKRTTKQSLLTSTLALLLCFAMLLGSTFAWFTDSVTSSGNKIVSGSLEVDLELLDKDTNKWNSIKENQAPIFNYTKWEPGFTDVKVLKVDNEGSLALKWKAVFVAENELSKLANVIDVYVLPYGVLSEAEASTKVAYPTDRAMPGYTRVGTLAEFVETIEATTYGSLKAGESAYLGLALKMQESAGNEYQKMDLGGTFDIRIVATQDTVENDSFDNSYDNGATFPELQLPGSITVNVATDANGKVSAETTISKDNDTVSAIVPAGVQLESGVNKLTLNVQEMDTTGTNITLGENEELRSLDVHIEGVSKSNTVPIQVKIPGVMTKGLNLGNYMLIHVENGAEITMAGVSSLTELNAHNQFYYDPATGDVYLSMATFSEVALVAEPAKWEGERDYSWYDASKNELFIANADQLAGFGAIVGGMAKTADGVEIEQDSFSGKTVKLLANIRIGDVNENGVDASENGIVFYPIGYYNSDGIYERKDLNDRTALESGFYTFEGTFDGNGHTISDWYQNTWEMKGDHNWYNNVTEQYYRDGMGLFGKVYKGTVKNLTIKNFSSDGEITTTGSIAAYADGATFENIAIFNCNPRVYNIGNGGIVGCVGWYAKEANLKTTFKNITVDNTNKISALWGSWDVSCGGILGQYYPTSGQTSAGKPANGGVEMINCHVAAQIDVYNDVCANYQYYAYRYAGMLIGSVKENVTVDGHVYPKMDGITFTDCKVHFGDWNDYYYCELVANSLASYTHDHQMSRLTQVQSVDVSNMKVTDLNGNTTDIPTSGRYNYVVVKAKDANGKWIHGDGEQYATCYHFVDGEVWNHEDAGTETVDGVEVLKEDKQLVYREFWNLVTGDGWGATSKWVEDFAGVTILDKEEADSVSKFQVNPGIEGGSFIAGQLGTLEIGVIFSAIPGVTPAINGKNVQVFVTPADENSNVVATYVPNYDDWTKGTISFTGSGNVTITITDYYFCNETTIALNFAEVSSLAVVPQKNSYDISKGEQFNASDIAVAAIYSNGGTGILKSNEYTIAVTPNITSAGEFIGTVAYTYAGKTVTGDFKVYGIENNDVLSEDESNPVGSVGLHFDFFSVKNDFINEQILFNGGGSKDYGTGLSVAYTKANKNYGSPLGEVTINNAQLAELVCLSGWVGYSEDFNQFGMYVNGDVSTLKIYDKFADGEEAIQGMAGQYAKRFFFNNIDLKTLNLHDGKNTITFVSVLPNGLKELTTWTVYWNCTAETNISDKTANVIILAGQSNAYGVSPYTDAINTMVKDTDFSNIRIRYVNLGNSSADITNATWQTVAQTGHDRFDVFTPGIGGPNAALFGPELALAHYLATNYPDEVWYIIKYAAAGSLLNGDWYDGTVDRTVTIDGKTGFLADAMHSYIQSSLNVITDIHGDNVNIRSLMWMQGESEAGDGSGSWAQGYAGYEQNLINSIRSNYGTYALNDNGENIKFIDAEIAAYNETYNNWIYADNGTVTYQGITFNVTNGVNNQKQNNAVTYWNPVNDSKTTNSQAGIKNSILINTSSLVSKKQAGEDASDGAHYSSESMWNLGTWFAEAMFK